MNLLRATPLLSLLSLLPACGPGNVCIGDCSQSDGSTGTGDPSNGTGEPTSTASDGSTTMDPPDTDPGETTTDPGGETGVEPSCELAVENDFDPLQGCNDGAQNPRELCFLGGTDIGVFNNLASALPVRVTGGGVDVLVNQSDRSVSAILDGPEPFFDTTQTDWLFQLANGTFTFTAAGDLDEDGIQDVVGRNITSVPGEESVHIFTLTADGDLKTQSNVGIGEILLGPAIVRWNDDDHLDIVVVAVVVGDENPSIVALRGDGTGAFEPNQQLLPFDDQHILFAIGGILGDDPDDFAVARADGDIDIVLDKPEFLRQDLGTTPQFHALEISDVNHDNRGDIVVLFDDLDQNSISTVGVLLQQPSAGDPTFELSLHRVLCNATALAIGDLDGDGAVDIVTGGPANPLVTIRRGDGQGGFAETVAFELSKPADRLFIADFDGNGARDILSLDLAGSVLGFTENSP